MRELTLFVLHGILIDNNARIQRNYFVAAYYQRVDIQFFDFGEINDHVRESDQCLIQQSEIDRRFFSESLGKHSVNIRPLDEHTR